MFDLICSILSLFFIICGILFLISLVFVKLTSFKNKKGFFVVLKADERDDDLYGRISTAFLEANMFNFLKVNKVVVLDYGVEREVKENCLSVFGRGGILTFINPSDAQGFFGKEEEETAEFIC